MSEQRIVVYTAADERYRPLADITNPLMARWCRNKGYELAVYNLPEGPWHPSWKKLNVLSRAQRHEVSVWVDADVFIRSFELDLSPWIIPETISFSTDYNGICAGFFVFTGQWPHWFLHTVLKLGPVELPGTSSEKHEQDTIKHLANSFPSVKRHIAQIPMLVVTNRDSNAPSMREAMAYHAWAGDWPDSIGERAQAIAKQMFG